MDLDRTTPSPRPARHTLARDACRQPAIVASSLLGLLLIAFTITGSPALSAGPQPAVRIAGVIYLGDLPTVIADHENLFRRHGLDASVHFNHSGRDNLHQLRAGETDFALMALTPIVLDRLADETPGGPDDPVILASLVHATSLNAVVARPSAGIDTPADLTGRRVALRKGTNAEFVWWLFAHFHGLDPDAVRLVDQSVPAVQAALRNGEVDAAVLWEPWLSRLLASSDEELRVFGGSNIYTAKWVLVTTRRSVDEHPDRARAMLAAYRDAIDRIERDPDTAISTYARRADVDKSILRRNWQALDYELNLQWSVIATLQQQIDWAERSGRQPLVAPIRVLELIESAPLRAVDPARVGVPAAEGPREPQP
ncbi:MAG: NrtA/SsuA/CpmA family ABC transporter substrate-binding protein [Halofilum sp. (in: g-proteobacteria)]|nr:NrtA/SsuA/CpmA family ABC transporter substrate-binding protein [Halofilum sp. (in: g-proteobacteria)]